jgi:flagellar biosynthesis GTPase FlhF
VLELERLVKKAVDAKASIQEKDVILMIGSTGSGKTTNTLKLLGYNFVETTHKGLSTLSSA